MVKDDDDDEVDDREDDSKNSKKSGKIRRRSQGRYEDEVREDTKTKSGKAERQNSVGGD